MAKRMLDLFCGRFGWSQAFAARGWECVGVDLVEPPEIPDGCSFEQLNILNLEFQSDGLLCTNDGRTTPLHLPFDFICASSPCEEFSVHGMKHFHPNPKYPEMGIKLFNHTRAICEASGVPYVMENVRPARNFVGEAKNHCGPFYLWGNGVPFLLPSGIKKNIQHAAGFSNLMSKEDKRLCRLRDTMLRSGSKSKVRKEHTAAAATIPIELSAAVVDYAEILCQLGNRTVIYG